MKSETYKTPCDFCGKEFDFTANYCCDGYMCGCYGRPMDPPVCSNECWDKLVEKYRQPQAPIEPSSGEDEF